MPWDKDWSTVRTWTKDDVAKYIRHHRGMFAECTDAYASEMARQHIDGEVFSVLTGEQMKSLGLSIDHISKLLRHIENQNVGLSPATGHTGGAGTGIAKSMLQQSTPAAPSSAPHDSIRKSKDLLPK
jgi:hypothetical protein